MAGGTKRLKQRARLGRGHVVVLLVAVVVAWVKVGDLVEIRPGPAAFAFTVVVLLSLLATALFDAHALWDKTPLQTDTPQ